MKKLKTFAYILLVGIVFVSCNENNGSENDLRPEQNYQIKIIDSCEYIYVSRRPWGSEFSITHKGNCKFCEE